MRAIAIDSCPLMARRIQRWVTSEPLVKTPRAEGEGRAERRYRAVDPHNHLGARGLERDWEERLSALTAPGAELARRQIAPPL